LIHQSRIRTGKQILATAKQVQSGQAIKLFQITPYVNDFQTFNNSGS